MSFFKKYVKLFDKDYEYYSTWVKNVLLNLIDDDFEIKKSSCTLKENTKPMSYFIFYKLKNDPDGIFQLGTEVNGEIYLDDWYPFCIPQIVTRQIITNSFNPDN